MQKSLPRLVIAATQSGAGKTTVVTGLLSALSSRKVKVQSFKVGPDYIDPGYHHLASGRPGHNLDTWLTPAEKLPEILSEGMQGADLAIIEGVMGLYDGGRQGISSTAEIARLLQAPVLLVIDAKSMGASAAAIAQGFRDYDREVNLAGVILNRVGSDTHEAMLREAMTGIEMPVYGVLRRAEGLGMPERHLGLTPVEENNGEDAAGRAVAAMGKAVAEQVDLDGIRRVAESAPFLTVDSARQSAKTGQWEGCRIALARDEAFSFYYPASLKVLEKLGAELVPFSPLHDKELPKADGLLLGGGFPEMFAGELSANTSMRGSVKQAAETGMPIFAECGGYMYLLSGLTDFAGQRHEMAGVLTGEAVMTKKLQTVGYIEATLQEDTVLGPAGTVLHGHEFHFSVEEGADAEKRPFEFVRLRNGHHYAAGQRQGRVLGSYLHIHFLGCQEAARHFVEECNSWKRSRQ